MVGLGAYHKKECLTIAPIQLSELLIMIVYSTWTFSILMSSHHEDSLDTPFPHLDTDGTYTDTSTSQRDLLSPTNLASSAFLINLQGRYSVYLGDRDGSFIRADYEMLHLGANLCLVTPARPLTAIKGGSDLTRSHQCYHTRIITKHTDMVNPSHDKNAIPYKAF